MTTKVHTIDSLKSQKTKKKSDKYMDKPKVNIKTLQDFSDDNYESESEYIVKKQEINDLCERSNMIIQQYRKDIIEAKGDYRLLKEKYDKLENFVEKTI